MSRPHNAGSVIHDIGYQRYQGVRFGRRYSARSMYVHSLRTAYGFGRSARAKLLPCGIFALACIAALVLVVVSTQLPEPVLSYVGIVAIFSYGATAFVAVVAPELVSRDLRNSLLPLYFSRPPQRSDYALAKLAALATAVFALFAGPLLIMFVGLAFSGTSGLSGMLEQSGLLLAGIVTAVIHAIVLAAVALPLASLSGRRVFATGIIIAFFLIAAPVSGVLREIGPGALADLAGLLDTVSLLNGVDRWLFDEGLVRVGSYGPVYGLAAAVLAAAGTALLTLRYRKVKI
ncbi:MAG: ABC transporter permease [Pseudonocardiaceae bacterium]|nr:ABC transporter permease [Pseudonocardiaceae bacterium]